MIIAQTMPHLSALQVFPHERAIPSQQTLLSLNGLLSFIRQAANMRILRLVHAACLQNAQVSYQLTTELRHLWLVHCGTDVASVNTILKNIGRELRTLVVRADNGVDLGPTLVSIATNCPKLQHLFMDVSHLTAKSAQGLGQLQDLRLLSTREALNDTDRALLQAQLQQRPNTNMPPLKIQDVEKDGETPQARFSVAVCAESIPVDITDFAEYIDGDPVLEDSDDSE